MLCLLLGWVVYAEVRNGRWSPRPELAPPSSAPPIELPAPLPEFSLPPLDRFAATTRRPLFLATRRPVEPEQTDTQVAPKPAAPLDVIVSGVIISEEGRFALVQRRGSSETLRLAKGDSVDGWTVRSILSDRVVFGRDEDTEEVELRDRSPPKRGKKRSGGKRDKPAAPKRQTDLPRQPLPPRTNR